MMTRVIEVFYLCLGIFKTTVLCVDPCTRGDHVTYVNHHGELATRSTNVSTTVGEKLLCDRTLIEGWYVFLSPENPDAEFVTSLNMPTSCVQQYHCGTKYPTWMRGEIPSPEDGVVDRAGCVTVGRSCCGFNIQIKVKNCGHGIVAYYLKPSPGCPAAYCFGDLMPCPPGEGSPTGFTPGCTPASVVQLTSDPVLTLENDVNPALTAITYACAITLPNDVDPRMKLEIAWFADSEKIKPHIAAGLRPGVNKFLLDEDSLTRVDSNWIRTTHLGKNISCKARSFFMKGAYSAWRTSNRKFAGIEIIGYTNNRIELDEGEDYDIQLKLHCPFTGADPLDIEVIVPESARDGAHCTTGEAIPQLVAAATCKKSIDKNNWKDIHTIKVRASSDNKIETVGRALRRVSLRTPQLVFSHVVWSNYYLPEIEISVKDKDSAVATCNSVNDPHMKTFDGVSYELQKEGYFVLYKHKTQPFEVHADYKSCGGNGRAPYCNCAVGILAADDVIIFDKCGRGVIDVTSWGPGQNRLRMATRGSCHNRGTRILRENGGRRYVIQLHTGTAVIVEDSHSKFINLYVEAARPDFGKTEGLCGLFDKDCSNDLIPKGAVALPPGYRGNCGGAHPRHPNAFTESWRLDKRHSILYWNSELFKDDHRLTQFDGHVYCTCADEGSDALLECKPGGDVPKCRPKRSQRDVTDDRLEQCRKRRQTEFHDHFDFLDYDESEYNEVSQPTESDVTYAGTPVHSKGRHKRAIVYTEETARQYCVDFIFNAAAGRMCGEMDIDTDGPLESCVLDLLATGETDWAVAALATVKQHCTAELDKNTTRWVAPSPEANITVPPPEIEGVICFNECSGNGACNQGTCECYDGFSSPDCSINIIRPPQLYFSPKCDLKTRPCRTNPVVGNNFVDNENLTCHFYESGIDSNGLYMVNTRLHWITKPANFESYGEVKCPLPLPEEQSFPREPGEAIAYKVHISNNGVLKSRAAILIVHNSLCMDCNVTTLSCEPKLDSCMINDTCYGPGQFEESDTCKVCNPNNSRTSWSLSDDTSCMPTTQPMSTTHVEHVITTVSGEDTSSKHQEHTTLGRKETTSIDEVTTFIGDNDTAGPATGLQSWEIGVIVGIIALILVVVVVIIILVFLIKRTRHGEMSVMKSSDNFPAANDAPGESKQDETCAL